MITSTGMENYSSGGMSGIWSRSSSDGPSERICQNVKSGGRPGPAEIFSKADEDGNGSLDQTEFESLLSKMSKTSNTSMNIEEMFAAYDVDGDGALNEEETKAAMEANRPQGPPSGDGMMGGMQGSQGIDFSQMFSDADEDGNGSIDETEFQTLAEKLSGSTETSSSESTRSALFTAIESYANMAFYGMAQNQLSNASSFFDSSMYSNQGG